MKVLRIFLTINVVIAILIGCALFFAPVQFTSGQGIVLNSNGLLFARALGGMIFAVAILNWYSRDLKDRKMLQGVLLTNLLIHTVGVFVDTLGIVQGTINAMGWGSVVFRGFLALGFLYFLIKNPAKKS